MDSIELDALILKNQPIAKEGVLMYKDGPKLKRWEDLEKNIGRVVPIIDEHPSIHNGMEGLVSGKEKSYGLGVIKQCPAGDKKLCADMYLLDGSPIKNGYSIGYPYNGIEEKGKFNGQEYKEIQADLLINHIAMTDAPRDDEALQKSWDSRLGMQKGNIIKITRDSHDMSDVILINRIGHDSFRFKLDSEKDFNGIKNKLKDENPSITDSELNQRALVMYANEQRLKRMNVMPTNKEDSVSEIDSKKVKTDQTEPVKEEPEDKENVNISVETIKKCDSRDDLLAEVLKLRAERDANTVIAKRIKDSETQARIAKDAADKYKKLYEEKLTQETKVKIDSLIQDHGFDASSFNGKHPEFIDGALFAARHISKGITTSSDSSSNVENDAELLDVNKYRWNWNANKMEYQKGGK